MSRNILRLTGVKTKVGLGGSTIYKKISQGTFPKPIQLSERAVGWFEDVIDAWLEEREKQSQHNQTA